MNLYRVILPVKDISAATEFYRSVLEKKGERVSPGRHYFDCGGTILACYDAIADGDDIGDGWHHHENQYFYFSVSNLAEAKTRVEKAGGVVTADIETMPWGETIFYAKDTSGNPIAFVQEETVFRGT